MSFLCFMWTEKYEHGLVLDFEDFFSFDSLAMIYD